MDFTEFLKHYDDTVDAMYQVEGEIPRCPPGYIWSRKRKECIPKTERDKVDGSLQDKDRQQGAHYNVWGSHGQNGAPHAYEEPFVRNSGGFEE